MVIKKLLPGCSINIKDAIRSVLLQQHSNKEEEEEVENEEEERSEPEAPVSRGVRKDTRMELMSQIQNAVKNKTLRKVEERPTRGAATIELSTHDKLLQSIKQKYSDKSTKESRHLLLDSRLILGKQVTLHSTYFIFYLSYL